MLLWYCENRLEMGGFFFIKAPAEIVGAFVISEREVRKITKTIATAGCYKNNELIESFIEENMADSPSNNADLRVKIRAPTWGLFAWGMAQLPMYPLHGLKQPCRILNCNGGLGSNDWAR